MTGKWKKGREKGKGEGREKGMGRRGKRNKGEKGKDRVESGRAKNVIAM